MKKVGLVTLYESDNYGTCLQAFALSEVIKREGYECTIIQYDRNAIRDEKKNRLEVLKRIGIKRAIDIILCKKIVLKRKAVFREFRDALPLSKEKYSLLEELNKIEDKYDAYVCGSDMLWSWESRKHLDVYFLKFAPKCKRVAYAPSFGNTAFSEEMTAYYKNAVSEVRFKSCREKSGSRFIEKLTGEACETVVDPTILLTEKQWKETFGLKKSINKKKQILCYLFGDIPRGFLRELRRIKERDEEIRFIPQNRGQYLIEQKHGNCIYGPKEFLQRFYSADMIVTNSFHGLVFALIFQKPFILLHRGEKEYWGKHEERMADLMQQLDISERYLNYETKLNRSYFSLDYEKITDILQNSREKSMDYLRTSIKCVFDND